MSSRPLKLISSMATREVLAELARRYQASTGRDVACEAGGGVDVAKRVQAGELADVVVLGSNAIDTLIAEGHVREGSRVDLVKSGIAVAVQAGSARPDVGTEEGVRLAVLAAKTVSFSTGPSGVYLEKLFARWGILDTIRSRIIVPRPGIPVGSLLASGEVALGFQQMSEMVGMSGIEVVGPLPSAIQSLTTFVGGLVQRSSAPAEAQALLTFMASPDTVLVKEHYGMQAP